MIDVSECLRRQNNNKESGEIMNSLHSIETYRTCRLNVELEGHNLRANRVTENGYEGTMEDILTYLSKIA